MLERTKPIWKPMVQNAVKSRPKLDRALKLVMKFRKKFKRPTMTQPGSPGNKMEYTYTPSEGNSMSYFTRRAPKLRGLYKKIMRTMPIQLRKSELVQSLSWPYGRQGVLTIINQSSTDLDGIITQITGNNTTRVLLQSTKLHYMITSGSKAAIKLRIYEGCFKKDLDAAFTPQVLWQNGMVDTGSTELIGNIDSKPFASVSFMQQMHISKVTNVFIPQGRTHEHYVDYRYNKVFNQEDTNATNAEYLQGWTRFTMFVAYGEPIADTDSDVSTASGRLLVVGTKTHRFRFNNPANYAARHTQAIPITGVSTERLLDEGSGEIETNVSL